MVYTKVEIILGFVINRNDLEKNITIDEYGYPVKCYFEIPKFFGRVEIHCYPCCSQSKGKFYLVGFSVHTYYRKHGVRCDKCVEPFVCNECLGTTNHGVYDVEKILHKPVQIDINTICLHCYSDKQELDPPTENLPIVDGYAQGNPDNPNLKKCDTCGLKPDWRFTPQEAFQRFDCRHEILKKLQNSHGLDGNIGFYYMLDDCLYCS